MAVVCVDYDENGDIDTITAANLVTGDFSTGDLSLGQTTGTVTVLNDADIDGTLAIGNITDVETEINTNTSSISTNSSAISTINDSTLANFSSGARVFQDDNSNTAMGSDALLAVTSGTNNSALGRQSLRDNIYRF